MRRGNRRGGRPEGGFAFIGVLSLIVLIGLLLAAAGQVASTDAQREREVELLYVGHAYRAALHSYYAVMRHSPTTLDELVQIGDGPRPVRFLRRLYRDPMTNAGDWNLIRGADGGILGISSRSTKIPLKRAGFEARDESFEDAETYAEWMFSANPPPPRNKIGLPSRP